MPKLTKSMWMNCSIRVFANNLFNKRKRGTKKLQQPVNHSLTDWIQFQLNKNLKRKLKEWIYVLYATWTRAFCISVSSFTLSVTEPTFMSTNPKRNIFFFSILFTKAGTTFMLSSFASITRILSLFNSPVKWKQKHAWKKKGGKGTHEWTADVPMII